MIRQRTRVSLIEADVFVTQGECSIGIVLYRDGRPIAAESFGASSLDDVLSDCRGWLERRELDARRKKAVLRQVSDCFDIIAAYRQHGPDIANTWPGSLTQRRLPPLEEPAA